MLLLFPRSIDVQQAEADGLDDSLLPAADLEFLFDIGNVEIDGGLGAAQDARDFPGRFSCHGPFQAFEFAVG